MSVQLLSCLVVYALVQTPGGAFLVDMILDQAGSKGTGKWTVQLAADAGIAVPRFGALRHYSATPEKRERELE
jgi:6-phosphogluconate dehydrogenase